MNLLLSLVFLLQGAATEELHPSEEQAGATEYPGLPRYPGMALPHASQRDNGAWEFPIKGGTKRVQGQVWRQVYSLKEELGTMPKLQDYVAHYRQLVEKKGGAMLYTKVIPGDQIDEVIATYKMPSGTGETWITIRGWEISVEVLIASTDPQIPKLAVNAAHIARTITAGGRITLYGILFEDGKDAIKPESEPVLREIAAYLKKQPTVSLRVEGFVDSPATRKNESGRDWLKRTKTLSQQRADAVVAWLTAKGGIAPGRLDAFGGGSPGYSKETSNEDNRSENRRIRLVKK
jgi:OmpA-OmpF porin, OOP family